MTKKKPDKEKELLEKLEEKPENLALRKELLNFYLDTNQIPKAIDELLNIAWIEERRGHPELALKCYQYIQKLDPQHMPLTWNAEKERRTKRPSSKIISFKSWKKDHRQEEEMEILPPPPDEEEEPENKKKKEEDQSENQ